MKQRIKIGACVLLMVFAALSLAAVLRDLGMIPAAAMEGYVLRDCGGLPFDDYDLCSLMSNLFDNAAESCLQEKHPEQTQITLKSGIRSGCFVIRCVNTCSRPPAGEESTKTEAGHGYGKAIIRSICEKYDGEYSLRYEGGKAVATVAIQLNADPAAAAGSRL